MKKGKEKEEQLEQIPIKQYYSIEPTKHGIEISDAILSDCVLEKVAKKMWEKELVQKYKKPYTVTWTLQHGHHMYQTRPEDRLDDGAESVTKYNHYKKNPQTKVFHREYEENEAPPPGLDIHVKEKIFQSGQYLKKNQVDYKDPVSPAKRRSTIIGSNFGLNNLKNKKSTLKSKNPPDNDDIEVQHFYEPVQLIDRENMIEFSDEEDRFGTLDSKDRTLEEARLERRHERRQDLQDYIDFHRRRVQNEEAMRLRREALLRNKKRRQITDSTTDDLMTTDESNRTFRPKQEEFKQINVAKLPKLFKDGVEHYVSKEYTKINKAQERRDKKKKMFSDDRPMSARSGQTQLTGGMTNAFTQYTSAQTQLSQGQQQQQKLALDQAKQVSLNKNYSLVDYLKYDTTLGREQNIELGKESSLVSKDVMKIGEGIILTEFAPQKRLQTVEDEPSDDLSENPNLMEFEKRNIRRLRDETEGRIQPREELSVEKGPEIKKHNQISLKEYQKKYQGFGTIGKMDKQSKVMLKNKLTQKHKQNPYTNINNRNLGKIEGSTQSSRELPANDSMYDQNDSRNKSAQAFRKGANLDQTLINFRYGGPSSRSNTRSHLQTYKNDSPPQKISIMEQPLTVKSYNLQNKIEFHVLQKFCAKQLIVDSKPNPYQLPITSDIDMFRQTNNTSYTQNSSGISPSIFSQRRTTVDFYKKEDKIINYKRFSNAQSQLSIFDNFNQKLIRGENPQTLVKGQSISTLTLRAKQQQKKVKFN